MDLKQLGKYEIIDKLGEGGFGAVYLANNTRLKKRVALKVLHPQVASDEMLAAYFEREALALARLEHTHIVRVFDYDQIDGVSFIVMEYIDGTTLDRLLRDQRAFALDEIVSIFRQLLSALGYAHENGVIHRDIKPSNIMLTGSGEVKIADFGIAKVAGAAKLTRTGTGAGSLLYMSPEQIKGTNIDNRSDIYSVGVTLYQVVAGRTPFEADSDYEIMTGHLERAPLAPSQFKGNVSRDLEEVILKAIEKKPEMRFQNAQEMSEALSRIKSGSEITVVARDNQFAKTIAVPKHPKVATTKTRMLISVLAAFAVIVVAVIWMLLPRDKPNPPSAQTFADSLATAERLFRSGGHFAEAAALFSVLRNSSSANQIDRNRALLWEAQSKAMDGDSVAAFSLFAELQRVDPPTDVEDSWPRKASRLWESFQKYASDTIGARRKGTLTDAAAGRTNPPLQQTSVPAATGSVVVTVDNYERFEPVTVIFDGKSERYQGSPLVFEKLAAGMIEVTLVTDMGRLTKQVQIQNDRKECSFTLSERQTSKLTVTSLVADNPDDIVPAQVYIDNEKIEDGETPFSVTRMNGSHKVWVEHEKYRTEGKPRFVTLSGDTQIEFVLRKK
ncbi:MAG: serine/threonine-protein kinase [candidate division Zixibacteria bacterium]|nr:serine/threonine-protein kinase [candidate division Zixibacteria bacterium]